MLQQIVQSTIRIKEEIMSQQKETLSRQSRKAEGKNVCHNIFRVCRDTEFSLSSASQPDCVAIEENYVATKDEVKRTKDWSRQRKVSLSVLLCFKWILENFMEFIYFSSFTISVNFPYQLVTDMCEPVLKN